MTIRNIPCFNPFHRRAKFGGGCLIAAILALPVAYQLFAQNTPESDVDVPPTIQAMVETLLTETAEPSLRQLQAQAILLSNAEQAQQALITILKSDNHTSAKIIICQAVAARPNPLLTAGRQPELSPYFIDPLFQALFSDNDELAAVAAQALSNGLRRQANSGPPTGGHLRSCTHARQGTHTRPG